MPPVKLACLACRATRVRCDGERPCNNCCRKERECSYLPSRRGGARKRGLRKSNVYLGESVISQGDEYIHQINELLIPTAGLQPLFLSPYSDQPYVAGIIQSVVRVYVDEGSLLNAYYIFMHPFFPVLPPPCVAIHQDDPIHWSAETYNDVLPGGFSSPLSLAISATLALIPLEEEGESRIRNVNSDARSRVAHRFAKQALEQVEVDTEYENFSFASQHVDSIAGQQYIGRKPLHPSCPVELESIICLLILSNYEQSQRGNLVKMATRSCQASVLARGLSLHCQSSLGDDFSEARRRTWWMTYATAYLTSLACHKSFIGNVCESEITTPYPQLGSDVQCWAVFIETLQISMASLKLMARQRVAAQPGQGSSSIQRQVYDLSNKIQEVTLGVGFSIPQFITTDTDFTASEVNSALIMRRLCHIKLASATIRIHRYQAFSDIPVFIKDYCKTSSFGLAEEIMNVAMSPANQDTNENVTLSPLTQSQSASLCVDAALTIARQLQQVTTLRGPEGDEVLPSLMPISACCAMDATHSMVMQLCSIRFSQASQGPLQQFSTTERLLDELFHGIERIVQTFEHHTRTYVSMAGMKGA